jgi:hypothetical protein
MAEPKEPQSYGSQGGWVEGNVDQEVNRLKGRPNSQHDEFRDQGGKISPEQIEENAPMGDACEFDGDVPPRNVNLRPSGAKRASYFRNRDYKA